MPKRPTRRAFLVGAARAAAGVSLSGLAGCFPDVGGQWPHVEAACADPLAPVPVEGASRVVELYREASVSADPVAIQEDVVRAMLADGLAELTGGNPAPWRVLLPEASSATRVGLKVNCLNQQCPTSLALTRAVVDGLRADLGLTPEQILVWDRRLDELTRAGFTDAAVGARVVGTVNSLSDPGGPGYGEAICGVVEGRTPRLSRILTDLTDLTINVPVLKSHGVSGVTAGLKNIYGIIDIPGEYHANLPTALPKLYALPPIRDGIRFTVLDALVAVTAGGTSSPADTLGRRVVLSQDPLALDHHALALVNRLREEKAIGLRPIEGPLTAWLQNGHALGLGTLAYELVAR